MKIIPYHEFKAQLDLLLNNLEKDSIPIVVTRKDAKNIIVMTLDDYKSIEATIHLLSSQKTAERLNQSIKELAVQQKTQH